MDNQNVNSLPQAEEFRFPKVDLEKLKSRRVSEFAGAVKVTGLPVEDDKFMRIWNR